MRQLHQVVVGELPIAAELHVPQQRTHVVAVHVAVVGNRRGIGELPIAHPDPDHLVPLDHREGFDLGPRRRRVLVGAARAASVRAEAQSVIDALDLVALADTLGKKGKAVRTAVEHGDRLPAALLAEEHHRLVEQPASEQRFGIQLIR